LREPLGRVVAALKAPGSVRRDEREHARTRRRQHASEDTRGLGGQTAEPTLLPGAYEPANVVVVGDRGAGGRERETAARALTAPSDRPGGRSATAVAERPFESRQPLAAGYAQLVATRAADGAAHRQ
jgi:hypothetical protein